MTANITKTLHEQEERAERRGIEKVARALLDVLDDEMIAMKTGLSQEEVAKLRQEQQEQQVPQPTYRCRD